MQGRDERGDDNYKHMDDFGELSTTDWPDVLDWLATGEMTLAIGSANFACRIFGEVT